MKNILPVIALFFYSGYLYPQLQSEESDAVRFSANFRLHPGKVNQTEVFITKSPVDDQTLFASCNTLNFTPFFISEGIYVSTNNGSSWYGSDTCTGNPIAYHGGDVGITIDRNGTFLLTRLGRTPFVGLYSHYSNDKGLTWSSQQVISTDDLERASLTSDVIPGSPYFGRSYAGWVTFASPFPVMVSYTDDGGKHWSAQKRVNNPPNRCAGGDIATGPNGEVYVCWAGVTQVSPFKEIYAGFARSLDGGATWQVTENAFPMSGISGILQDKDSIRVNSLPALAVDSTSGARRGWIYMVTCQKGMLPAGSDPDIILYRSADGGQSWSAGIRVNQDPLNNGKTQYFPAVHVDRTGAVNILYYDDRNTNEDSVAVFLARSRDGGDTWKEYEISDHRFKPKPIGGLAQGYQGDNIDLTSTSDKIWPVWMDNSSGIYQIWTVPVLFSEVSGADEPDVQPSFEFFPNTPNPFLEKTTFRFRLASPEIVRLEIFNLYGQSIALLSNQGYAAGIHELEWVPVSFQCGVIIARLTVGKTTLTRKLVKIR